MIINNQEINIDDLYSQKYMHKEVKKGIFLSEYQIDVLRRNGINIDECGSINDLMYYIDDDKSMFYNMGYYNHFHL